MVRTPNYKTFHGKKFHKYDWKQNKSDAEIVAKTQRHLHNSVRITKNKGKGGGYYIWQRKDYRYIKHGKIMKGSTR